MNILVYSNYPCDQCNPDRYKKPDNAFLVDIPISLVGEFIAIIDSLDSSWGGGHNWIGKVGNSAKWSDSELHDQAIKRSGEADIVGWFTRLKKEVKDDAGIKKEFEEWNNPKHLHYELFGFKNNYPKYLKHFRKFYLNRKKQNERIDSFISKIGKHSLKKGGGK